MTQPWFSDDSLERVQSLLQRSVDWNGQFLTGIPDSKFPRIEKTLEPKGLQGMDIDHRPGVQPGDQGKRKGSSLSIAQVALPNANPQPGPRSLSTNQGLSMFEESCRPKPQPRSPQQQSSTQQAQQAAQQQGQTFDTMPQKKVEDLARKGGEAERKNPLPYCN